MDRLMQLSLAAHERALTQGTETPAERLEFAHLPMFLYEGVPCFDGDRMRPDQIDDAVERLESLAGKVRAIDLRGKVWEFMRDYGRLGVRLADVVDMLHASKPGVLKYLRELEEAGLVVVKEEATRGNGASKRKRYFWAGTARQTDNYLTVEYEGVELNVPSDNWKGKTSGPGIIFHGTSAGRMQGCACAACVYAFEEVVLAEERSAALRRGETGLECGLDLRRVRRERERAETRAILFGGRAA